MKDILNRIHPRFYVLLSGILLGFTIVFPEIGVLSYVALIPLACVLYKRASAGNYKVKKAYCDGFIFYLSFDLVAFHWLAYFYPLDFAGIGNVEAIGVIALAWIGLSALQSVFSAFVFVVISRFMNTVVCKKYPILLPFAAACLFAANEWTQTFTWAGVPWARIAISQTEMPIFMQSASVFGSYFLTFIVVLFNFLIALFIVSLDKRRKYAIIAVGVLAFNTVLGSILYLIPSVDENRSVKIASVQGNMLSQERYYWPTEIYETYRELTAEAVNAGAEIVIWPEGTFPMNIHDVTYVDGVGYLRIEDMVASISKELGVTIVLGTYVESVGVMNASMSVFYNDGSSNINAYAKRRPVPFGEFLPLSDLIHAIAPVLAEINIYSTVVPGEKSNYFTVDTDEDSIKVGTLMCFDAIYENLGIDSAREGAEIFIIPSNDSWFYDSRALHMHHAQNILRAVEQGKYTVNCGNTGITSVITDKGEVVNEMPIFTKGYVLDTAYASSGRTLYSYIGNLFVYLCIATVILMFAFDISFKRKCKI